MRTEKAQKLERGTAESWNTGIQGESLSAKPLEILGESGARDGARTRDLRRDRPTL
jgi:hypothetical protein